NADLRQGEVQEAVAGVKDVAPYHGDRDQRGDYRREEDRAEQRAKASQLRIHEQRRDQRQSDRQGRAEDDEVEGVAERLPEQRVLQQGVVVAQSDEAQIGAIAERIEVEIGQAHDERACDRQEEEQSKRQQRRRDEQPGGAFEAHEARSLCNIQRRFSKI